MAARLSKLVTALAQRARAASLALATAPTEAKNTALRRLAELLPASADTLLAANARDLAAAKKARLTGALVDRLTLNPPRIAQMAEGVGQVAALPDPVGEELERTVRPNGLEIRKVRVPIGVIGIIYESRPNVTIDCAALCLKSGNAAILRGGKECFHTNRALVDIIHHAIAGRSTGAWSSEALAKKDSLPSDAVQLIPTTNRAALTALLKLDSLVHCIIPRGGEGLIRFVAEHATIPVIKHFKGVCFVYVDQAADAAMAERIVVNAKAQRPAVCNAAEQLLVHRAAADALLPRLARALVANGVALRCDPAAAAILKRHRLPHAAAKAADYTTEFLDLVMAVRIVPSLEDAIATINRDSSAHTDAIVTADAAAARRFLAGVDSAVVLWNASTRFNDGFEFGLGAEIGISTDRLHARGPMGLRELCSYKYVVTGSGQVRS
ncbi:MAG TPA: glutamate-5-semialdehyde dehydrogenase [Opitutaceae bacterium]|nr:glutamate-5-semialdehyde dehydrogenase [Opitutaceae bacterium]